MHSIDDLRHLVRRAEPLHWDLLDDLLGARGEDRGVDLARCDGRFTRTPSRPKSCAISRVRPASAAFEVA